MNDLEDLRYEPPIVRTLGADHIRETLGPAQGYMVGSAAPMTMGFDSGTPRQLSD